MSTTTKKIYRQVLFTCAILILCFDFWSSQTFKIEAKYLFLALPPLFFGIYLTYQKKVSLLHTIGAIALLAVGSYQFLEMLMFAWGSRFIGASIPFIWIVGMIINFLICASALNLIYEVHFKKVK